MNDKQGAFEASTAERLITYWQIHRRFDANIRDLARYVKVSRDTAYRWLNRKAIPKPHKAQLINEWLDSRKSM